MVLINPNQIQSLQYDEHVTACLKNEKDVQNHTSKNKIKNSWKKNSSVIAMDMAMGIVDICEKYNCG